MFCQKCGGFLIQVRRGGCGGRGSIKKCRGCRQVFEQVTGGIVGTPGGETLRPLDDFLAKIWGKEEEDSKSLF